MAVRRQVDHPRAIPTRHAGHRRGCRLSFAIAVVALAAAGCSATGLTGQGELPPDVQDPSTVQTSAGAMAFYRGALHQFPSALQESIAEGGLLTDELADLPIPVGFSSTYTSLDSRTNVEQLQLPDFLNVYYNTHRVRAQVREARGFLQTYVADSSAALQGQLYAIEGYAEILLADLFCSGIPLSTVDYAGDYTLAPGSTTTEVYTHARTLFDSALTLVGDSVQYRHLAAIGRARALLALGDYADAAAAVAGVPDDYVYQIIEDNQSTNNLLRAFVLNFYENANNPGLPSMADREGIIGLDYRSSGDPRTKFVDIGTTTSGSEMYYPAKYPLDGVMPITVADGLEARLIEAEAALQANEGDGQWLAILNHLRQTALPDTVLPDLPDPGTRDARVDLLFRERAFWLYLTGHRQGDLRRLVRQYQRTPNSVYPSGPYPGGNGSYGSDVTIPVPNTERQLNPKYTGCINRNA